MNGLMRETKGKHNLRRMVKNYELYLFLLPALAYFLIFCYWPMYGVQIAFKDFNPVQGILGSPWAGLKYFERFITGPNFWTLLRNTLTLSFGSLLLGFPLSVVWALVLNEVRLRRLKNFAQTVSYLPYFISTVVIASMILIFLKPDSGFINRVVVLLGGQNRDFMANPEMFAPIYIISGIWQMTGWNSIVYLSSLSGVDQTYHEAAMIDGATRLQRIWHINIPCILPTIVIMFIMTAGRFMSIGFEKAWLLQNNLNLTHSEIISTYVYKIGLLQVQYSFSAAVGLFNSIINCVLLVLVNYISGRLSETSLW